MTADGAPADIRRRLSWVLFTGVSIGRTVGGCLTILPVAVATRFRYATAPSPSRA